MSENVSYIIYEVLHNGIPIYIGSGLPDRYLLQNLVLVMFPL